MTRPPSITLRKPIGASYFTDETDVLNTKKALGSLGYYRPPDWGLTGIPDEDLFDGLKAFQRSRGLDADGLMRPEGPTHTTLDRTLREREKAARTRPRTLLAPRKEDAEGPHRLPAPPKGKTPEQPTPFGAAPAQRPSAGSRTPRPDLRPAAPMPGGPSGSGQRKPASPGGKPSQEQQVAWLVPLALQAARYLGPKAAQEIAKYGPAIIGGAMEATRQATQGQSGGQKAGRTVPSEPPPPTPGSEPPREPEGRKEEIRPAELPRVDPGKPIRLPDKPTILVTPAEPRHWSEGIQENRKGNDLTKAEIDAIRDRILDRNPGWTHWKGGREQDSREEQEEYRIPGPGVVEKQLTGKGDSRPGSHFTDLSFKTPEGKIIHIQHVDGDRSGKPTSRELENAEKIRRATGHHVYLIVKQWQKRKR